MSRGMGLPNIEKVADEIKLLLESLYDLLIVSDGHKTIGKDVSSVYDSAEHELCALHFHPHAELPHLLRISSTNPLRLPYAPRRAPALPPPPEMGDKKKKATMFIRLVSAAGTGFFYVKRKPTKITEKLEFRKYDPRVNRHVLFTEAKMK
ncbi:unnamed protein product [Citrullus colocynthis]